MHIFSLHPIYIFWQNFIFTEVISISEFSYAIGDFKLKAKKYVIRGYLFLHYENWRVNLNGAKPDDVTHEILYFGLFYGYQTRLK